MQKMTVITGGNAGLGFFCAERAIQAGHQVCLASRSLDRADIARRTLLNSYKNAGVHIRHLDLSDLNSVSEFAKSFELEWDVLINNAGAKIERPFKTTSQGYEWHVGVNHIGHFALTAGLMKYARAGANVTTVSSIVARRGRPDFDQDVETFNERKAYANSKLMNLMFALELAEKFKGTSFTSTAAHPGFARASSYGPPGLRVAEYLFAHSARLGSDSIWSATSSSNGSYLAPRHFELWGRSAPAAIPEMANRHREEFWTVSEVLSGAKFPNLK